MMHQIVGACSAAPGQGVVLTPQQGQCLVKIARAGLINDVARMVDLQHIMSTCMHSMALHKSASALCKSE